MKRNRPATITNYCGECQQMEWNFAFPNRDVEGRPIHGKCKLTGATRIRTEAACNMFERQMNPALDFYTQSRKHETI